MMTETSLPERTRRPALIAALLFFIALINYFDRQCLSIIAPQVQTRLHLTDTGYAHVVSIFLFASAAAYALSGFVADYLGTRRSMTLFVALWSLAEFATAFVKTGLQLGITRCALGLGEPGLWVAAPKAVSETLSKRHRSLAIGVYTAGATVGAIVAVPVVIAIASRYDWQFVFTLSGVAGFLWIPCWLWLYPGRVEGAQLNAENSKISTRSLLTSATVWKLLLARAITDPVWYFYLFWFPKYLVTVRHCSPAQLLHVGWIVYFFAGIGTVFGGYVAGQLIRKGREPRRAYRLTMAGCVALVLISPLTFFAPSTAMAIGVASSTAFAHMAWLVCLTSILLEVFTQNELGRGAGLVAAGSAFGGMISSELVGYFVSHSGYRNVFLLMMLMHPLALALLWRVQARTKALG